MSVWCHASGRAIATSEYTRILDEVPCSRACGVSTMSNRISGGHVHLTTAEKSFRPDDFVITVKIWVAGSLPFRRRRRQSVIAERRMIGFDPRIEHSDDDPFAHAVVLPRSIFGLQPQEVGSTFWMVLGLPASGMQVQDLTVTIGILTTCFFDTHLMSPLASPVLLVDQFMLIVKLFFSFAAENFNVLGDTSTDMPSGMLISIVYVEYSPSSTFVTVLFTVSLPNSWLTTRDG
ncbi:hypothetical protein ACMD2_06059 [Ananas comosus]|uniref:Uncharacterized protein n=1 Tax=Ananas comosus TaxID=4615 RepID=A0A199UKC0_ANACO|nr:hypothetical protein ACMD2_06059 [Ananas comosus]